MNKIMVCGDIHGSSDAFYYRTKMDFSDADETDSLICVGDVGLSYDTFESLQLKKEMSDFPGTIYIMRGNHDDRYWQKHVKICETSSAYIEEPQDGWAFEENLDIIPDLLYEKKYPNIKYIRDEGDILNINGYNILFIPGAYSIDKEYRVINNLPYEPQEQLTLVEQTSLYKKIKKFIISNDIDYIISHTAPLSLQEEYQDLFLNFIDQKKVDKNMEIFLDEIYTFLVSSNKNFKHWYFGHYHDDRPIRKKFSMLHHVIVELGEQV